jgi:hypothetical protein
MTTLSCAICGRRFKPDDDHVWIDAEHVRIDDRNERDAFADYPECWQRLSEGWVMPR